MNDLKLTFTIDELNLILSALGNLPYAQVAQLIAKIHQQVAPQINEETEKSQDRVSF